MRGFDAVGELEASRGDFRHVRSLREGSDLFAVGVEITTEFVELRAVVMGGGEEALQLRGVAVAIEMNEVVGEQKTGVVEAADICGRSGR